MFPRVIVVYPDEESEMSRDLLRGKYVMIIAPWREIQYMDT